MNIHKNNIYFFIVLTAICLLPSFHILPFDSYYNEKRVTQVALLALLSLIIITSYSTQDFIFDYFSRLSLKVKGSILIFFVLGAISASLSVLTLFALLEISNYILLFLLSLVFFKFLHNQPKFDKYIILSFVISATLYLVAFVAALTAGIFDGVIDYADLFVGFNNRRFFNQFQSISFPILVLASLTFRQKKIYSNTLFLLASLWFMLMLVSNGRGVTFASLSSIIIIFIIFRLRAKEWLKQITLIIITGTFCFFLFSWALSSFEIIDSGITRTSSGGRFKIWSDTLALIQSKPVFGFGPMHYAFLDQGHYPAHPHNLTIQIMVEWGIPAAIVLLFIIYYIGHKWLSTARELTNNFLTLICLSSSFFAAILHGHLSGIFVMPLSQLSFALISGWMLSLVSFKKNSDIIYEVKCFHRFTLSLIVISSISITIYASVLHYRTTNIDILGIKNKIHLNGNYTGIQQPRFWSGTIIMKNKEK